MITESIDTKTVELIEEFSGQTDGLALPIRDWYRLFPQSFFRVAPALLNRERDILVLRLMLEDKEFCRYLCDPALLDLPEALSLARTFSKLAADLDVQLAHSAVSWVSGANDLMSLRRCMALLESLSPGGRLNGSMVQLLASNDGAVRSKVFQLLIRNSFNEHNIQNWLRDPDPRIRANLTEFLTNLDPIPDWVEHVLRQHLPDTYGRIAANSAVGLFRMGREAEATARLLEMAVDENPLVRSSAAWAMGHTPNPQVIKALDELRTDSDPRVRWNALRSMLKVNKAAPRVPDAVEPPAPAHPEPIEPVAETVPDESEQPAFPAYRTFGNLL